MSLEISHGAPGFSLTAWVADAVDAGGQNANLIKGGGAALISAVLLFSQKGKHNKLLLCNSDAVCVCQR